ncbi:MAG: TIGR02147 family protein [Chitinivibrionales bacterium]|nr:TIGR02147 family protein [Chitinivibrionales bacterium]
MKEIFSYIDYREFLKDYYKENKEKTHFFSYRYFSNKAGIKSPVFFKLVAEGKRNLTAPMIEKFRIALKLNEKQSAFFRHLVMFNQAKTALDKQEHYAILRSMAHVVNEYVLAGDAYDYYDKWHTSVVRELLGLRDFKDDYKAMAAAVLPAIKPREAKEAVALLLKLGLIARRPDGSYRQTHAAISTGSKVLSLGVRNFNRRMTALAGQALDNVPMQARHVSGVTMGISPSCYDVLTTEINAFKERVIGIVNADQGSNAVYQMNIQLFPVSKSIDRNVL